MHFYTAVCGALNINLLFFFSRVLRVSRMMTLTRRRATGWAWRPPLATPSAGSGSRHSVHQSLHIPNHICTVCNNRRPPGVVDCVDQYVILYTRWCIIIVLFLYDFNTLILLWIIFVAIIIYAHLHNILLKFRWIFIQVF